MKFIHILLFSFSAKTISGMIAKGPCPKLKSNEFVSSSDLAALFIVPFEVFTPNYLILPTASNKRITLNYFKDNIIRFYERRDTCDLYPGLRFNNESQMPEAVIIKTNKDLRKELILDKIELNFQVTMVLSEDVGIVWGCAEINDSTHDEALIIYANSNYLFEADKFQLISKGLKLIENSSVISETDLIVSDPYELANLSEIIIRDERCENLKRRKANKNLNWILFGIFIVIIIIRSVLVVL